MLSSPHYQAIYNYLLRSFQQTKTHLSITNLNTQHLTQNPQIFSAILQKITKKLKTTKVLNKLTLDLKGIQLDQQFIKSISRNLIKELRDIQNLEIILSPDRPFQNHSFELLLKALRAFRDLKILEVALPTSFQESPKKYFISDLTKALKKSSPRLKEAKFTLIDETSLSLSGLPILKEWRMSQLGNLQKLSLHLPKSVFINKNKLDLSPLKRIKGLKSLNITLVERRADDSQVAEIRKLAFHPSKVFPNVKHFKWNVVSDFLKKTTPIERLGSEIASRLRRVEDFGLGFQQNSEIANREIKETIQILTSLKVDLNQLSVTFNHNELTHNSADAFIGVLASPELQNMHTLCLEFLGCTGINGVFINKLAQTVCQNMKGLRSLRLSFELSQSRSKSFTGPFAASEGLADQEINKLGVLLLEGCENLDLISLEFWRYSHISDKGAMSLCNSLSQIKSLKTARLQFKFCPKVSSVSVSHAKEKFGPDRDVKFTTI